MPEGNSLLRTCSRFPGSQGDGTCNRCLSGAGIGAAARTRLGTTNRRVGRPHGSQLVRSLSLKSRNPLLDQHASFQVSAILDRDAVCVDLAPWRVYRDFKNSVMSCWSSLVSFLNW